MVEADDWAATGEEVDAEEPAGRLDVADVLDEVEDTERVWGGRRD